MPEEHTKKSDLIFSFKKFLTPSKDFIENKSYENNVFPHENNLFPYENNRSLNKEIKLHHLVESFNKRELFYFIVFPKQMGERASKLQNKQTNKEEKKEEDFFEGQSLFFGSNYKRFIILLFLALIFLGISLFFVYRDLFDYPLRWTLGTITFLGMVLSLGFIAIFYNRRGIMLDDFGISYKDEWRLLNISWWDIKSIHLHAIENFFDSYPLCYVRVVTSQNDEFGFANYGNHFLRKYKQTSLNLPYPIIDIRDADLLLALLVEQAKNTVNLPNLKQLQFHLQGYKKKDDLKIEKKDNLKIIYDKEDDKNVWGLWAILLKVGFKFIPPLFKSISVLLKTIKPLSVGISFGLYTLFFTWQFAVLLSFILLIHELGHVWAMHKFGMRIKGIYFIPFFGAATVTDDVWPSWYAQAKVNFFGPLWGTFGVFLCLFLYYLYPTPFWLSVAIWGALINLLNLLPVHPLDGGRILNAIAYSLRSSFGFFLVILFLLICIGMSLFWGLLLLYILALIGIAEFFREYMLRLRANKVAILEKKGSIDVRGLVLLKSITGINLGERNMPHTLEKEDFKFRKLKMITDGRPMTSSQILKMGILSFLMAIILLSFLIFVSGYGMRWAIEIFH